MIGLACGAIGYASFFLLRDPAHLIVSEIFIGIFWASVLAMPYAILASSLPQAKLGIYMGLFNMFVVLRSEEHTSELQSLMRISYAVFCLKKKKEDKHYVKIQIIRHMSTF